MASGAELALKLIMTLKDEATEKIGGLGKALQSLGTVGLVAGAAVAAAVVAVGAAAFTAGQQWDDAMDSIAIATGATGEELAGLEEDFKAVFTSIPTEAGPAADAIAALNARAGMTGEILQETAKPLLEMTRLLGGDAKTNAELFTRVMGDWGISNEDAAGTLDKLFVASQETGAGVEGLMQKVVQFGSPLRLMGFGLEDSIALFAKWEKEGVNAELVMGSLRIAAGQFAKAGIPLQEGLRDTISEIQNMEDASAALALGMGVFGARAGPDMVAAIREGRFAADDLVAAMQGAEGAIQATADATADFPEKLQILKNVVSTALAPLGLALMDIVTTLVERLSPALIAVAGYVQPVMDIIVGLVQALLLGEEPMGDWGTWWETMAGLLGEDVANAISNAVVWIQNLAGVIGGFVTGTLIPFVQAHLEELKGALIAIGAVLAAAAIVTGIIAIAGAVAALANPITAVIAVIALLGAAWAGNWGGIQEKTASVISWLQGAFAALVAFVQPLIEGFLAAVSAWWTAHGAEVMATVQALWTFVQSAFSTAVAVVQTVVQTFLTAVQAWWTEHGVQVMALVQTMWLMIQNIFTTVTGVIYNLFMAFLALIRGDWDAFGNYLTTTWDTLWTGIKTQFELVWTAMQQYITIVWQTIGEIFRLSLAWITTAMGTAWASVSELTTGAWSAIVAWLGSTLGNLWNTAFAGPLADIYSRFRNFWTSLFDNIHIKTPHFKIKWQDVFGVSIPTGVSVSWYGMGGDFMVDRPTLIGVGERGPERVQITPVGAGAGAGSGGATYSLTYIDQRPNGGPADLLGTAERLEWRARMRR